MSGHSKWATTKRHKAVVDAKRSNLFTKLARGITVAARTGKNLDIAIASAKRASMPKDNIQRAIDKGTGKIKGVEIIQTSYEAYGPEGIGVIIDVLTDNKNRAVAEIKAVLNKHNGKLASSGAVAYLFERNGVIELKKENQSLSGEDLEMVIIESGAKDYEVDDGILFIYTDPKELAKVRQNLEFKSLKIDEADLEMSPKNYVAITEDKKEKIIKFLEALEDLEDVSHISTNANL